MLAGDGGLRAERVPELWTPEKGEVVGEAEDDDMLLVERGVKPRRRPDCELGAPQTDCWDLEDLTDKGFSVPEAIDDWAEGEGGRNVI